METRAEYNTSRTPVRQTNVQSMVITDISDDERRLIIRWREVKQAGYGGISAEYHNGTYQIEGGPRERGQG